MALWHSALKQWKRTSRSQHSLQVCQGEERCFRAALHAAGAAHGQHHLFEKGMSRCSTCPVPSASPQQAGDEAVWQAMGFVCATCWLELVLLRIKPHSLSNNMQHFRGQEPGSSLPAPWRGTDRWCC